MNQIGVSVLVVLVALIALISLLFLTTYLASRDDDVSPAYIIPGLAIAGLVFWLYMEVMG